MSGARASRRQPPTPRAEGRQHLVGAAVDLLHELPVEQITVRAVAERAGHHHRFINEWFGGKSALFREVLDELLARAVSDAQFPYGRGGVNPNARAAIEVMGWLAANDRDLLSEVRPSPVRERVADVYRDVFGLEADLAELVTERTVAATIGMVLFGDLLGVDDARFDEHRLLDIRIAELLAADDG